MLDTFDKIIEKEDSFYIKFLDKVIMYADNDKKVDGIQVRQLISAAGVVAKQRQTRGAMKALSYQIARDVSKGIISEKALLPKTS